MCELGAGGGMCVHHHFLEKSNLIIIFHGSTENTRSKGISNAYPEIGHRIESWTLMQEPAIQPFLHTFQSRYQQIRWITCKLNDFYLNRSTFITFLTYFNYSGFHGRRGRTKANAFCSSMSITMPMPAICSPASRYSSRSRRLYL